MNCIWHEVVDGEIKLDPVARITAYNYKVQNLILKSILLYRDTWKGLGFRHGIAITIANWFCRIFYQHAGFPLSLNF
jgi:hypothetical protein